MTISSASSTTPFSAAHIPDAPPRDEIAARRAALPLPLRDRHAQGLTRLLDQRRDLRGVYPLADFVDDAVRWTA